MLIHLNIGSGDLGVYSVPFIQSFCPFMIYGGIMLIIAVLYIYIYI